MKMGDQWTVPVCARCHTHWHSSLTYRRFPGFSVAESDYLVATTELELMAHYIRTLDPETDLF